MKKRYLVRKMMKRILACALAFVLAVGMTACGSDDDDEDYEDWDEDYEDWDEDYEEDDEDEEEDLLENMRRITNAAVLPHGEDELSKEISMSLHPEVVIGYSPWMRAEAEEGSNTIKFLSSNKTGTFDEYASMTVMLDELNDQEQKYIDSLMDQGPGVAKHYMEELASMYICGAYVDYSLDMRNDLADFADLKDAYLYSCPVEVWESEFDDVPEDLKGCLYVKYVGSAGYLMTGLSFAPVERADEYAKIGIKMMVNAADDTKFSTDDYAKANKLTQPKEERPKAPDAKAADTEKKNETSGTGDQADAGKTDDVQNAEIYAELMESKLEIVQYDEAYFWADADGNCWFYDGEKDTFWSDKKHGAVDEKGAWIENPKYEWPDLMYSDGLGDNEGDEFDYEDDDMYWDDSDYEDDEFDDDYDEEEYEEDDYDEGDDDSDYDDGDDEDWDDEDYDDEDWDDEDWYEDE